MTPGQRPGIRLFRFQHSLVSATENTGFPWEMMSVISQRKNNPGYHRYNDSKNSVPSVVSVAKNCFRRQKQCLYELT